MAYNVALEQQRLRMRLRNYAVKQFQELSARMDDELATDPDRRVEFDQAKAEVMALVGAVAHVASEPEADSE
jgi:hypothetical protein